MPKCTDAYTETGCNNLNMTDRVRRYIKRHYKPGMQLFPSAIRRNMMLKSSQIISILNELECDGTLNQYFYIHCPSCHFTVGYSPESLNYFANLKELKCQNCGETLRSEWDIQSMYYVR